MKASAPKVVRCALLMAAVLFGVIIGGWLLPDDRVQLKTSLSQERHVPIEMTAEVGPVFMSSSSDQIYKHEFEFTNATNGELRLSTRSKSCQCIGLKYTPQIVAAGESAKIEIATSIPLQKATHRAIAKVATSSPDIPEISCSLVIRCVPYISVLGHSDEILSIPLGSLRSVSFEVECVDLLDRSSADLSIRCDHPNVAFEIGEPTAEIEDGYSIRKYPVTFTIDAANPIEELDTRASSAVTLVQDANVSVSFGNQSEDVRLLWRYLLPINATPASLIIRHRATSDETNEVSTVVRSAEAFAISRATSSNERIEVFVDLNIQSASHRVILRPPSGESRTLEKGIITLHTDHPLQPTVSVPVVVYFR